MKREFLLNFDPFELEGHWSRINKVCHFSIQSRYSITGLLHTVLGYRENIFSPKSHNFLVFYSRFSNRFPKNSFLTKFELRLWICILNFGNLNKFLFQNWNCEISHGEKKTRKLDAWSEALHSWGKSLEITQKHSQISDFFRSKKKIFDLRKLGIFLLGSERIFSNITKFSL